MLLEKLIPTVMFRRTRVRQLAFGVALAVLLSLPGAWTEAESLATRSPAAGNKRSVSIAPCGNPDSSTSSFNLTATEKDFALYFPAYLANGYFTTTTSLRGTEPTLSLMAGLMDYTEGDVSRPAAIPSWAEIDYFNGSSRLNSAPFSATTFKNYRQTLQMHDGLLSTQYTWVDGDKTTSISVCTLLSEASPHLASTRLTITPNFTGRVTLHFTLHPYPPPPKRLALAKLTKPELRKALGLPTDGLMSSMKPPSPIASNRAVIWYPGEVKIGSFGGRVANRLIWIGGRAVNGDEMSEAAAIELPAGLQPTAVKLHGSPELVDLEVTTAVEKGKSYSFTKYVGASREGWKSSPVKDAVTARTEGFSSLLAHHLTAWHDLWKSDVVVEGDPHLQTVIHSDLFYLLENSTLNTDLPMGACGLSPNYLYHVFWDNDTWDFPVMLLLHPERAKSLVMFRYRTLPEAEARARKEGYKGAMFPWESDPQTGAEVTAQFASANANREVHINGDVAIAQWEYYSSTKDKQWLKQYGYPVIRGVAEFWASRVTYNQKLDRYEILHVTSPDEAYDDVPNDSFTNAVAQKSLRIASAAASVLGLSPDPQWAQIADKMYIPFSSEFQRYLDFDASVPHNKKTWAGSNIAQLSLPALDLPMTKEVLRNDYEFASKKLSDQTTDTNEMFVVPFSIEAAMLGRTEESAKWVDRNLQGFLKPPFNVRSETAHNNTLYILATSSGFLQDFLYGFTGMRLRDPGLVTAYSPVLPLRWKSITLRNISAGGQRYDFHLGRDASGKVYLKKAPSIE